MPYVYIDYAPKVVKKLYPLYHYKNNGELAEACHNAICDIWSYVKSKIGESITVWAYQTFDNGEAEALNPSFYLKVSSKETTRIIMDWLGFGSFKKNVNEKIKVNGLTYELLNVTPDYKFDKTATLKNIPWFTQPLIDEDWLQQCFINNYGNEKPLARYVNKIRVYELTEGGATKENVLLLNIGTEILTVVLTFFISDENMKKEITLDDIFDNNLNYRYTLLWGENVNVEKYKERYLESVIETTNPLWFNKNHYMSDRFIELSSDDATIDDITDSDIFNTLVVQLEKPILEALNKKRVNPNINEITINGNLSDKSCDIYHTEYKQTEEREKNPDIMKGVKIPRWDRPLIYVAGHWRHYKNGKKVFIERHQKHKRMKKSWYEED